MCLICTAVPMTASLSIAAHAEWKEKAKKAKASGSPLPKFSIYLARTAFSMVGTLTVMLTVVLIMGAIIYHTTILPRTGI